MNLNKVFWYGFLRERHGDGSLVLYDKDGPKPPDGCVCLFHFNRNVIISYKKDAVRPKLRPINKQEQSLIDAVQSAYALYMKINISEPIIRPAFDKEKWIKAELEAKPMRDKNRLKKIEECQREAEEFVRAEEDLKSEQEEQDADVKAARDEINAELSDDAESLQRSEDEGWYYDDTNSE
jgi:hypothetical protein